MASVTLYCPSVKMWNVYDDYWENYSYTISGSYKEKPLSIVPPHSSIRMGLQRMEFDTLPVGTITSATLHWRSYCYGATYNSENVYFRASSDPDAWHNTEPPNTISQTANFINGTMTDYSLDITSHINTYGSAGSALYLYAFVTSDVFPANLSTVWHYSGYMPYIEITYTPPSESTIGLYNGSAFTDRIIKKRVSGAWVQCDCYKYNATTSSWEKVSTT